MKKMAKVKFLLFYPFLLALYPLLALLEFNIGEVTIDVVWRPMLWIFASALLLMVFSSCCCVTGIAQAS